MKAKTIKKILKSKVKSLADYVQEYVSIDGNSPASGLCYEDPDLPQNILDGTIVTGGCIVSMLLKEKPNDYDFYFKNRDLAMRVAKFFMWLFSQQSANQVDTFIWYREDGDELYKFDPSEDFHDNEGEIAANGWRRHYPSELNSKYTPGSGRFKIVIKSAGIASTQEPEEDYQYFENFDDEVGNAWVDAVTAVDDVDAEELEEGTDDKGKHHPKFMSSNAITLAGKIQLVTRFYGEPSTIHENYDFIHCTCYYTSWDNHLELPQAALEAMLTKELRYVGSLYPLCSIIRVRKFVSRGWQINAGQILKMCMQLNELDLKNLEVLEDQLVGVDAAYFLHIISRLQDRQEERIKEAMEENNLSRTEAEEKVGGIDTSYLITIIDRIF